MCRSEWEEEDKILDYQLQSVEEWREGRCRLRQIEALCKHLEEVWNRGIWGTRGCVGPVGGKGRSSCLSTAIYQSRLGASNTMTNVDKLAQVLSIGCRRSGT